MTAAEAINAVIGIAEEEIGYLEKRSNSQLDSKTANAGSGNYTKYWRDIAPSYQAQPWCAGFVSWCFYKAFGLTTARKLLKHWPYVYCPDLGNKFTRYANPEKGDIVIFTATVHLRIPELSPGYQEIGSGPSRATPAEHPELLPMVEACAKNLIITVSFREQSSAARITAL